MVLAVLNTHYNSLRESYTYIKIKYGLRMSDDNQNNSLWANLTNKIKYKLFKATYDPDANTYADEKAKKTKKADEKEDEKDKIKHDTTVNTTDPNKFSVTRLAKKTISKVFSTLLWGLFIFLPVILAMIVTNELIVYSVPIRIIFFIFIFVICFLFLLFRQF